MTDAIPTEDHPSDAERAAALEGRIAELETRMTAQLIRAELKAEAVRAGMVDLDGLKLLDLDHVVLSAKGEVEGGAAMMRDLRRSKPWLFASASSSSSAIAPPAEPPKPRLAKDMSHAEWQAARAELVKRR
jgi:hypothetical protein